MPRQLRRRSDQPAAVPIDRRNRRATRQRQRRQPRQSAIGCLGLGARLGARLGAELDKPGLRSLIGGAQPGDVFPHRGEFGMRRAQRFPVIDRQPVRFGAGLALGNLALQFHRVPDRRKADQKPANGKRGFWGIALRRDQSELQLGAARRGDREPNLIG
jgi:hypothetical protein